MSILGLDEAVVTPLLHAVAGQPRETDELAELFARATWTGIAEPGDRVAGALVASLGAVTSLTAVVERWDVAQIVEAIAAADVSPVDEVFDGQSSDDDLGKAMARWTPRVSSAAAVLALKQAARFSAKLVLPDDPVWPRGFDALGDHAPLALWARGHLSVLATTDRSIALVGARAATGYGEHVTMEASAGLVDRGYTIVSGAAYGIDGMAHRAALASSGRTIAVLAGGVDRFYPSGHEALLTRIVESGVVVSELPCGQPPTKWRFLLRNRLIAAASMATVVLEAGWRSGSLNTAGHAASIGRPLGAVPGPVTSAASAGCHRLIREFGAACVTNAEEMAELAPLDSVSTSRDNTTAIPSDQLRVLDALSTKSARPVSDIAARAGLSVPEVQAVLGLLEIEGAANEREIGWVKRRQ